MTIWVIYRKTLIFFFKNTIFERIGTILIPRIEKLKIVIALIRILQKNAYECTNKIFAHYLQVILSVL